MQCEEPTEKAARMVLINLPVELLFKILSYLPTRDKIMMRRVSRRFKDVSEMPLLWREFVWPDYEPRHVRSVSNVLEVSGEHVRRMFFPTHVTPTKILEMARYCTKVTHLSLPRGCQLSLDHLEEIVNIMTHLIQLDVFVDGNFIQQDRLPTENYKLVEGVLKVTAASVKELNLRPYSNGQLTSIVASIERRAKRGHPLPSIINIYPQPGVTTASSKLFKFWSSVLNFKLPSFEIGLYDTERAPMNLYPAVPMRKFQFGPLAKPPFIRLSNHGIVGLKHDVFHLREYNHHGTVRCAITPELELCRSLIEEKHFSYPSNLHSVTYADISNTGACLHHLKQLAVVCPNLEQLNLQGNVDCLKDLQGLHSIVHTCQNLTSMNLSGIPVSSVESCLLLWELLSSLKKLTHLVVDLCVLQSSDSSNVNKESLISMFRSCQNLKALEICCDKSRSCTECNSSNEDFLFSYFPSLTHCTMRDFQHSGIMYAINNCHRLKYLHEYGARACEDNLLPLLNGHHHLQELHIDSPFLTLSDEAVEILSAHGELEHVTLHVNSITVSAITALINNSPNLMLLKVSIRKLLFNDNHLRVYNHTNRVKKMFSHHKLFNNGSFAVHSGLDYFHYYR